MEQEDINKEIDWLMGSIKRSSAIGNGASVLCFVVSIFLIVIGVILVLVVKADDEYDMGGFYLMALGGVGLVGALIPYITRKKMSRAETPQELLAVHDRMWVLQAILFGVVIICLLFFGNGSFFARACFALSVALFVVAGWLSMRGKLRLWPGIMMLIVESVLLYFSEIGFLVGLPMLLLMLSIIQGKGTLFKSFEMDKDEAEECENEIKQLRELVRQSGAEV